jgi:uncharacterized protein (TIGR02246 family)
VRDCNCRSAANLSASFGKESAGLGAVVDRIAMALIFTLAAPVAVAASPAESAVVAFEQRQADAWNAHDAAAYAALFTKQAHVVNVLGWHWTSRDELQQKLTRAFAFVFAKSRLTIEQTTVSFPAPGIAIARVQWTMSGAISPAGGTGAPEHGIQLQVLVKRDGMWAISDFQNTNSIPERPFPLPH